MVRYKVIYSPAHGDLTKKKTKTNKQKPQINTLEGLPIQKS